jgi:hypothetical protein
VRFCYCLAAVVCGIFGIASIVSPVPFQTQLQQEVPAYQLANTLRFVEVAEFVYATKNNRLANQEELLGFLGGTDGKRMGAPPLDLANPIPYEFVLTVSQDGKHYQSALKFPPDVNRRLQKCRTAAFSDEHNVVFIGQPADCDDTLADNRVLFHLLPGYRISLAYGIEGGVGGKIWKDNGPAIEFQSVPNMASDLGSVPPNQISWRFEQKIGTNNFECIYVRPDVLLMSISGRLAVQKIRAKVRNQQEIAEVLSTVMSFDPDHGYLIDPSLIDRQPQ